MEIKKLEDLQTLVSLSKRRGFVFQSSEIYGGLNSCWDYGPLGSQLKLNVVQSVGSMQERLLQTSLLRSWRQR